MKKHLLRIQKGSVDGFIGLIGFILCIAIFRMCEIFVPFYVIIGIWLLFAYVSGSEKEKKSNANKGCH